MTLAKGENKRERVLTDREAENYLAGCPQPWKTWLPLCWGVARAPGELYVLRWENLLLNGQGGLLYIVKGKTKAEAPTPAHGARCLSARSNRAGKLRVARLRAGCFLQAQHSGHMEESSAKQWHVKALKLSGIAPFEPYCLRHTALTNFAKAGVDAFTLARIAGHSRISTTERYIHPQAEAIEQAFAR